MSRLRCLGLAGVCAVSVLTGLLLVFRLVTVDGVSRVHTYELVGLLGLLVLPVATAWAYIADRRTAAAERVESAPAALASGREPRTRIAATLPGRPLAAPAPVEHEHDGSDSPNRGADRHRRRIEAPARREHETTRPARGG